MTTSNADRVRFLDAFHAMTAPHSTDSCKRVFNGVVEIAIGTKHPDPGYVVLDDIRTSGGAKARGHGKSAMAALTKAADASGMHIVLDVVAYEEGKGGLNDAQLREFYKGFGFKRCGGDGMSRSPQTSSTPAP